LKHGVANFLRYKAADKAVRHRGGDYIGKKKDGKSYLSQLFKALSNYHGSKTKFRTGENALEEGNVVRV